MSDNSFDLDETLRKMYVISSEVDNLCQKIKLLKNEKQRKKKTMKKTDIDDDIKKIRSDAMKEAHNRIKELKESKK